MALAGDDPRNRPSHASASDGGGAGRSQAGERLLHARLRVLLAYHGLPPVAGESAADAVGRLVAHFGLEDAASAELARESSPAGRRMGLREWDPGGLQAWLDELRRRGG